MESKEAERTVERFLQQWYAAQNMDGTDRKSFDSGFTAGAIFAYECVKRLLGDQAK